MASVVPGRRAGEYAAPVRPRRSAIPRISPLLRRAVHVLPLAVHDGVAIVAGMKSIRPHPDHHELHGITVAVETRAGALYVGRCHDVDQHNVYLVDADEHAVDAADDGGAKRRYLEQVARFGHWSKHPRLAVSRDQVLWMERLGHIAEHGPPA